MVNCAITHLAYAFKLVAPWLPSLVTMLTGSSPNAAHLLPVRAATVTTTATTAMNMQMRLVPVLASVLEL